MVTEYRKEAADNAVMVASSMRPMSVLRRTLDHLIVRVVDLVPDGLAAYSAAARTGVFEYDWHKYIWDRMRAIEKVRASGRGLFIYCVSHEKNNLFARRISTCSTSAALSL